MFARRPPGNLTADAKLVRNTKHFESGVVPDVLERGWHVRQHLAFGANAIERIDGPP